MRRIAWVLGLLLLLVGCCQGPKAPDVGHCRKVSRVWLDPSFSEAEVGQIAIGADAWSQPTGICFRSVLARELADVLVKRALDESDITDRHPVTAVGLWSPDNRTIWIVVGGPAARLRSIAAHEFGHYLGLGHSDWPPGVSVMAPHIDDTADPAQGIPALDVAALPGL